MRWQFFESLKVGTEFAYRQKLWTKTSEHSATNDDGLIQIFKPETVVFIQRG